jgi:hypothetical protein
MCLLQRNRHALARAHTREKLLHIDNLNPAVSDDNHALGFQPSQHTVDDIARRIGHFAQFALSHENAVRRRQGIANCYPGRAQQDGDNALFR